MYQLTLVIKISQLIDAQTFPSLKTVSLGNNELQSIISSVQLSHLKVESIFLDNNEFEYLQDIEPLFNAFSRLANLSLQENRIEGVLRSQEQSITPLSTSLQSLNLARNHIKEWFFLDQLATAFPSLASLRIGNNPFNSALAKSSTTETTSSRIRSIEESSYMLTLARFGNLRTLNFSTITPQDRLNGELYYLSSVEHEFEASSAQGQVWSTAQVNSKHPRYLELCRSYDREPVGGERYGNQQKQSTEDAKVLPGSLAARLVKFKFMTLDPAYSKDSKPKPGSPAITLELELPKTMSTYSLKALIARKWELRPLGFHLIYESEELDPIAERMIGSTTTNGADDDSDVEWDVDPQGLDQTQGGQESNADMLTNPSGLSAEGKKWKKREVEMMDSTREVGSWLDSNARQATVRIEVSSNLTEHGQ